MPADVQPTGSIADALANAGRLLAERPDLAAEQALAILEAAPGHPQARLLAGAAKRRIGEAGAGAALLTPLSREQPNAPMVWYELGLAMADLGRDAEAAAALRRATTLKGDFADAWRVLGDVLTLGGDGAGADAAYARAIAASVNDPDLVAA